MSESLFDIKSDFVKPRHSMSRNSLVSNSIIVFIPIILKYSIPYNYDGLM